MHAPQNSRRSGFTLVELLVVIAIIAILASLTTVAVFKWVDNQHVKNTKALIKAVHGALDAHWDAVIADAKKEPIPPYVLDISGGSQDRARLIWIKMRLTEAFPMSYYEVNFHGYVYKHVPPNPTWIDMFTGAKRRYQSAYMNKIGNKTVPANDRTTESAACLLAALSVQHGSAASLDLDMLPIPPLDTDNDGVKEIVDSWGQPISFFRFPTQPIPNVGSPFQAANPNPGLGDPLDTFKSKLGNVLLTEGGWFGTLPTKISNTNINLTYRQGQHFQELCRYTLINPTTNSLQSYFTIPVVVSRGPDTKLGLRSIEAFNMPTPYRQNLSVPPPAPGGNWPTQHNASGAGDYPDMSITNAADAADNIYSYMLAAPQ